MRSVFLAVIVRDVTLYWRRRSDVVTILFFFAIVTSLFPLGVGPEISKLRLIAPGVIWVAALLTSMLSLNRMFSSDYQDGTLEQFLMAPQPLSLLVLGKILAHWLVSGLPLILIAPALGLQFDLPSHSLWILVVSLLLGTPILGIVGAIGAALTLGLRGGNTLIALLVLPLYVPVLIFGTGAVDASLGGQGVAAHLSLLAALLVFALFFGPIAAAAALKISQD
jgi:heme exporter protein B